MNIMIWSNCVECDTLLLADIFENFRNKYIEICGLNLAYFLSAPDLAWQAVLIKTEAGSDFSHVVICY